ncbi:MAG: DoxX family protein [Gemmatimonadota bacterium]|nr:MAG: DoxX family protein [Gemmatimonadota bacterium]
MNYDRTGIGHFMHNALRIWAGFFFWMHGVQKLFGVMGWEDAVEFGTRMGTAGLLEFFGGLLIILGLFTRPVAFILALEMVLAYYWVHLPRSLWPIMNDGDRNVLFMGIFVFLAANGAGAFSLDGLIRARRREKTVG